MFRLLLVMAILFTSYAQANEPIISGHVLSHYSKVLNENRRFMVALPENYHDNKLNYPTLYIVDGDFQFQHVSAVVKNMTRMGKIPPMIVIGIANQGNADYIYQTTWAIEGEPDFGGAALFYKYINQELLPHIDGNYRTNRNKILSGYSLGGLFTTYAMVQENTQFNAYLAMSPSYWFDDYSAQNSIAKYIDETAKDKQTTPSPLFLSVANEQEMGVDKVYKSLSHLNFKDWRFTFKKYLNENHFSTALPAFHGALSFLFEDYYEDSYALKAHNNVSDVLSTFENKKQNYNGFRVEWLQAYKFSKYVFGSKQTDKIADVLAEIKIRLPNSIVNITNYLALGFNRKNQFKEAKHILDGIKPQAEISALWHHQYSLALAGLDKFELAKKSQARAMELAKNQNLPMWQIWEMK